MSGAESGPESPRDPAIKALENQIRLGLHQNLLEGMESMREEAETIAAGLEASVKHVPTMKARPLVLRNAFYHEALGASNRLLALINGEEGANEQLRLLCNSANLLGQDGIITDKQRVEMIDAATDRNKEVQALAVRASTALTAIMKVL